MISGFSDIEWIVYAVASAVLTGLMPNFLKLGTQKVAPSVSACIYNLLYCAFIALLIVINKESSLFAAFRQGSLVRLICLGTITAFAYLSLTTALSYGGITKVIPILLLRTLLSVVIDLYTASQLPSKLQLCSGILIILGVLLLESGRSYSANGLWVLFALIALVLLVLKDILLDRIWVTGDIPEETVDFAVLSISFCVLLLLSLLGRVVTKPGKMGIQNWVFLLLAGVAYGLAALCTKRAELNGLSQYYKPIASLWFPVSMLFARVIHKEEFPVGALFGILLVVVGSFALMLA